jgi:predicted phage terminase large subunit-like protein
MEALLNAGGGKSYALLLDPLRYITNENFRANIFRRTTKQITVNGGLWDESKKVYYYLKAIPKISRLEWIFKSNCKIQFSHLEHEKNVYDYQGAQIAYMGFDELTHFTEFQFFYMLSRNRSTCGIRPCVRATTNPDKKSWVRKLIEWWIDEKSGYPIKERSGKIRWFIRIDEKLVFTDSKEELIKKYGTNKNPKSLTFIPAKLEDNKILIKEDPSYVANLDALSLLERSQLKDGNWNTEATAGMIFKKHWFEIVDRLPPIKRKLRAWDRAATEVSEKNKDPDFTATVKIEEDNNGIFYITDANQERLSPFKVEEMTLNTAKQDGIQTTIKLFQDPGSAGVYEIESYKKLLIGYDVKIEKITKDKLTAALPVSAASERGKIKILRAKWNDLLLDQLNNFPDGLHDDLVDCLSSAYNCLNSQNVGTFNKSFYDTPITNTTGSLSW